MYWRQKSESIDEHVSGETNIQRWNDTLDDMWTVQGKEGK
jgi:hypothetical protein